MSDGHPVVALIAAAAAMVASALLQARRQARARATVCAWCKSAKRPRGGFARLERYTRRQQTLAVSHGICRSCVHRYFPETEQVSPPETSWLWR